MSRAVKIALILLGGAAAAVLGALFAVKKLLPPEKIRGLLLEKARENLHRQARVGGVSIGLFSGLAVSDFALSEKPDFKAGTFLESEAFILKFQIRPLLRKKIVIDRVELVSPKVTVIRNADGRTFNFSDLLHEERKPAVARKEEAPAAPSPLSLTVAEAVISKGKVRFEDRSPKKLKLDLDPIDLKINGSGLSKPLALEFSIAARGGPRGKAMAGTLKGRTFLDLPGSDLKIESLVCRTDELTLELKGGLSRFQDPIMDLSASLHSLDLKKLSRWAPLPKGLVLSGSPQFGVRLKGGLRDLSCSLTGDFTAMGIAYADVFSKPESNEFSLALEGNLVKQDSFDLKDLKVALAGLKLEARGSVGKLSSAEPRLDLRVNLPAFDLAAVSGISPIPRPYGFSGRASLNAEIKGGMNLPSVNGSVKLEGAGLKVDRLEISAVTGSAAFSDDSFRAKDLTGRIGREGTAPADFKITVAAKNFSRPDVELDARFGRLDLGMFLTDDKKKSSPAAVEKSSAAAAPAKGPELKARGRIAVDELAYVKFQASDARLSWDLSGITPGLSRISGTAECSAGKGRINDIPLLRTLAPVLRLDPSSLVFSKAGGRFKIENGTAGTDDFQVNGPAADLFVRGILDLPANRPDMVLTAKLPRGSLGGAAGEFTADEDGRPTFAFKLKGDWRPALDSSLIRKQAVRQAEKEIKKKAADLLQNEGKKLLEGIFKR